MFLGIYFRKLSFRKIEYEFLNVVRRIYYFKKEVFLFFFSVLLRDRVCVDWSFSRVFGIVFVDCIF